MYCDWPVLGRCCFCLPLRKGVLVFGYVNLIFSAFMIGIYSFAVHTESEIFPLYHGTSMGEALAVPIGACVAIYCIEVVFTVVLLLGAHQRLVAYIKTYYYFAITTTVASLLIQIIDALASASSYRMGFYFLFEVLPLTFASMCIQIYLIILIRSLLRQMEVGSGPHACENQLQQIVYEGKVETNGVYDTTVVPVDV